MKLGDLAMNHYEMFLVFPAMEEGDEVIEVMHANKKQIGVKVSSSVLPFLLFLMVRVMWLMA
jgi:hypothetical protein